MNVLTVDFHTHILPGIDDGCQSIEDSVKVLQMEYQQGIKTVFLTPHFHPQHSNPESFLEKREAAMSELLNALRFESDIPEMIPGAEVSYCPGMSKWESLDKLTIGDTGCMMIEMHIRDWNERVFSQLESIYYERGITPIIAHIERYFSPLRLRGALRKLLQMPVLLQSNCSFFNTRRTHNLAMKILKEHGIHLLGSDCHSPSWRAPNMEQTRKILLDQVDQATLSFLSEMEEMVTQSSLRT